ncbi:MAG: hypothetical protein HN368_09960 [Spirochaetales bacterium]|jgi:hypothetical protein|nr:hypothetical protein [Spirochaetales bacterium]
MDSKSRMLKNWNFEEPDRIPIEIYLYASATGLPGADEISDFEKNEADNFRGVTGFDWGFLGLDSDYSEEIIEEVPGIYTRMQRTHSTPVGDFTAITRHNSDEMDKGDYFWEKRFIDTVDDFRLIAEADRTIRPFHLEEYNEGCIEVGNRGLVSTGLLHPLGVLVRYSKMEEVYAWMLEEEALTRKFLENSNTQVSESILSIGNTLLADPPVFMTYALEMLTPPWMGKYHFDKLVFPYDKMVNDSIHTIGARHRAHCHGNSGGYLELFADMGIDAVEPLEPAPYGDNVLEEAKQQVSGRMLLSGNVPSQAFYFDQIGPGEVRELTMAALAAGAPGGGFSLKTTGGAVGNGKTKEQGIKNIALNLALIETWREFCG